MSFRIETLWAFVSPDNADGDEGLVAVRMGPHWVPLVAADETRLQLLRSLVEDMVTGGKSVRLVKFEGRVDVEVIGTRRPS